MILASSFHFPRRITPTSLSSFYIPTSFSTFENSDEIRSQETRWLQQVTKNGSEDGLHYLVLSMRGIALAVVRATWLEKEDREVVKKMGQAWCKEKTSKAQDSKSPLDRVFVRCAHRVCYRTMFYCVLEQSLIDN